MIIHRVGLGRQLTGAEVDGNFDQHTADIAAALAAAQGLVQDSLSPNSSSVAPSTRAVNEGLAAVSSAGVADGDKGDIVVASSGTSWTVDAGAITLAKMANLAQDQVIIRTSASTGVPQTATITAAARTVLDDVDVASMVNTLGGAPSSGTGGLARLVSPAFTTPTLGTPASVNLSNATGVPANQIVGVIPIANLATGTPTGGKFVRDDGVLASPAGSGTVTNSTNLTANALVLGNATTDTKAAAGLSSDGVSVVVLGVAGSSNGGLDIKNATSGTIAVRPPAGALGTPTVTWPNATGTLALVANVQPLDADLTTIAGLTATTDNFMQAKAGAWASRTLAQVNADLLTVAPVIVNESTTTRTLTAADNGKTIRCTHASGCTVTVPTAFSGFSCTVVRGNGAVTLVGSGTTLNGDSLVMNALYTAVAISPTEAANTFDIMGVTGPVSGAEEAIASATTTNLGSTQSFNVSVTGTTTITGFGTAAAGVARFGRFAGILTLTHNATSLILPNGGSNITTAAGDRFMATSLGSGNWLVNFYAPASGVGGGGSGDMVLASVQTVTGAKTFNSTKLLLAGSSSGAAQLNAPAVAGTNIYTLPAASTTLAGVSQAWGGPVAYETPTNKTYTLVLKARFAVTVTELTAKMTSGTCSIQLTIDGTNVTGGSLAVTSAEASSACTAANVVAVGQTLAVVVSSVSSPVDLQIDIGGTRVLA